MTAALHQRLLLLRVCATFDLASGPTLGLGELVLIDQRGEVTRCLLRSRARVKFSLLSPESLNFVMKAEETDSSGAPDTNDCKSPYAGDEKSGNEYTK